MPGFVAVIYVKSSFESSRTAVSVDDIDSKLNEMTRRYRAVISTFSSCFGAC